MAFFLSYIGFCEISTRKNEYQKFRSFMDGLKKDGGIMVGYNNLHFDYPITDNLLCIPIPNALAE
jgi:exonuclease I